MNIELPPTIAAFFQAFNAHDTDTFTALFAGDAFVADEGREYRGVRCSNYCLAIGIGTNRSNQAMELTTTRCAFAFCHD